MEIIFCCGVPFFFIALSLWYVGGRYWPDHFKITYFPLLNNEIGIFLFAVIVLLIPTLGCCTGYLLLPKVTSAFEISEEGWILLEKPPQEIRTLKAAEFHTIYAETIDGRLIYCYHESAYDNDCWHEVSQVPDMPEYAACNRPITFSESPSTVKVAERIDIAHCGGFAGMDETDTSSYVLTDDGQVYQNRYGSPSLIPPPNLVRMIFLFSAVGMLVGLLIAFGVMSINKRWNTRQTKSG